MQARFEPAAHIAPAQQVWVRAPQVVPASVPTPVSLCAAASAEASAFDASLVAEASTAEDPAASHWPSLQVCPGTEHWLEPSHLVLHTPSRPHTRPVAQEVLEHDFSVASPQPFEPSAAARHSFVSHSLSLEHVFRQ